MVALVYPLAGNAAGFGINATRSVYPEGAKSINITVRNTRTHEPYLVSPFGSIALAVDGPIDNIVWQTIADHGGLSASCRQTRPDPLDITP